MSDLAQTIRDSITPPDRKRRPFTRAVSIKFEVPIGVEHAAVPDILEQLAQLPVATWRQDGIRGVDVGPVRIRLEIEA